MSEATSLSERQCAEAYAHLEKEKAVLDSVQRQISFFEGHLPTDFEAMRWENTIYFLNFVRLERNRSLALLACFVAAERPPRNASSLTPSGRRLSGPQVSSGRCVTKLEPPEWGRSSSRTLTCG